MCWPKEAIDAFQKHVPSKYSSKEPKKNENSEVMKEFKRLLKAKEEEYGHSIPNQYPYPIPEVNMEGEPIRIIYKSQQYQTPPATGGILLQDAKDYVPAWLTNESILPRKIVEKFSNKLKEINDMPEKEKVLVFPRSVFEKLGAFTGVCTTNISREGNRPQQNSEGSSSQLPYPPSSPSESFCDGVPFLQNPIFLSSLTYMDRDEAETNENFLQLIPYCVFKCGKNFLVYKRTKKGGESRLHDKYSLGVGGHLNPCDGEPGASYEAGMIRELKEEVDFDLNGINGNTGEKYSIDNKVLGLIYDNSNAVGRVHFGVIHLIEVNCDSILNFHDEALDKGSWFDYDWLLEHVEQFESWSQLTIEHLG